jgi:DNA mismatch endonuclease (patch repair protein)
MTDRMTPEQRHRCMSHIKARDTRPEIAVRRFLWSRGYRYRLCRRDLPGSPDIVISRLKTAIFINGCFWHGHPCNTRHPRTNADFWRQKIERNQARDLKVSTQLRQAGWNVITIWECELAKNRRDDTLKRLLTTLQAFAAAPAAPSPYAFPQADTDTAAEAQIQWE